MLILVRFLIGSRNLFQLRFNFLLEAVFFFFSGKSIRYAFVSKAPMYEADAEIAGAAVAQVGQVGMSLSRWMGFYS